MEPADASSSTIPPRTHQTPGSSTAKPTIESSPSSRNAKSQPPSPEVISSLISSLAAISTPAEHQRNGLPRTECNTNKSPSLTPSYRRSSNSTTTNESTIARDLPQSHPPHEGFGVDYGAYRQPEEVDQESYLVADTAYAPVIRMSKQRATSSSSRSRTPTLKGSQQSLQSKDETASMARPSPEPGLQPSSAIVASSKGGRIARLLGSKRSKEVVSNAHNEQASSTGLQGGEAPDPLASGLRPSNSHNTVTGDKSDEAIAGRTSLSASPRMPSQDRPSSLTSTTASSSHAWECPGGMGSGRIIPFRQSSLHHTTANSSGKKSSGHNRASKDFSIDQDVMEEEDSTVRRIRELQKQKEKREREQRREQRRAEKKRSRNSMPGAAPPQRTTSNQSLRHSMAEIMPRVPDQASRIEDDCAPAPDVYRYGTRPVSVGQSSSHVRHNSRARAGSLIQSSPRSSAARPSVHLRALSDPQHSPGRGSLGIDRPRTADSIDDAVEAYLASPRLTQRIRHPETGRVIAFSEVGDPLGFPVICCVGMGMTRYIMAFYDELALTLRLRLITIDRPGVGESEQYPGGSGVPLNWPDDVCIICTALSISKFSLIAHSAGAIYALATALRLPQQVRGRLHLMAPWIPPSQMLPVGSQKDAVPSSSIPYSQKLLRVLPASFLRAANSSFISSTTSSIISKSPRRSKRKSAILGNGPVDLRPLSSNGPFNNVDSIQQSVLSSSFTTPNFNNTVFQPQSTYVQDSGASRTSSVQPDDSFTRARQYAFDSHVTQRIWELAQRHANPAVDLLICLERNKTIGFRYVDITRACVFHHGSRDSRVPVENVKWLAKNMRRCEVRILEGEGHSLMASAKIMAGVLTEVAREWEDWARVTREGRGRRFFFDPLDD